ncbi:MAG: hypothetical protein K8I29_02325 [Alphaproteobacteria bacterium]|uniref:Uncharacterized protein n=1 Tax=Candidatus Nitrobium versatile TaxID=2884831 RepID=A0A953JAB1_9BACT|nr:hypothetical protein [Candidatus Nitrobium versatile]
MERIESIIQGDQLFPLFGMELVEASEGYAVVRTEAAEKFIEKQKEN